MIYQCINCNKKWTNSNDDISIETKEISHGLCKECLSIRLLDIYRKKQLKEGNFDCYGKFNEYCDQDCCCYKDLCVSAAFMITNVKYEEKRIHVNELYKEKEYEFCP